MSTSFLNKLLGEMVSGELRTMGLSSADPDTQRQAGAMLSAWFDGEHTHPPCAMPLWLREAFDLQCKAAIESIQSTRTATTVIYAELACMARRGATNEQIGARFRDLMSKGIHQ